MERLFFGRFLSEFEAVGWMRLLKIFFDAGLRTLKDSEPIFFPSPPLFIFSQLSYQLHLERVLIAILVRFSMTQESGCSCRLSLAFLGREKKVNECQWQLN